MTPINNKQWKVCSDSKHSLVVEPGHISRLSPAKTTAWEMGETLSFGALTASSQATTLSPEPHPGKPVCVYVCA